MDANAALEPPRCRNCGTGLTGPWCAECGQRDLPPDPSLRELVAEAWGEFVSIDGKVLSSLRLLLLRPGALTVEYLAGRRVRHLPPLRLYLVCSVAYFLVSSLVPDRAEAPTNAAITVGADTIRLTTDSLRDAADRARSDSLSRAALARAHLSVPATGPLDSASRARGDSVRLVEQVERLTSLPPWMRRRIIRGSQRLGRDKGAFGQAFKEQLPRLLFVLMPVFAVLLALAYRSRRRRYPVHLIVALHLHAFVFAILALDEVPTLLPWAALREALGWVTALWILAYLPLALRRVYGGRLRWAAVRAATLVASYSFIGALASAAMAAAVLLTL